MTTSELTKRAIEMLEARNCVVWRQNQIPVKGRAFIGKRGQSDIIGFNRFTGIFVAVEVKNKGDKLSFDQRDFLFSVANSGGIALVARIRDLPLIGEKVELLEYLDFFP